MKAWFLKHMATKAATMGNSSGGTAPVLHVLLTLMDASKPAQTEERLLLVNYQDATNMANALLQAVRDNPAGALGSIDPPEPGSATH